MQNYFVKSEELAMEEKRLAEIRRKQQKKKERNCGRVEQYREKGREENRCEENVV
jgi:hypothetical protein